MEKTRRGLVSVMMAWRPPRSALLLVLRERTVNREVTTAVIKMAVHPRGLLGIILIEGHNKLPYTGGITSC